MIKSNSNCFQLIITSGKWLDIGIKKIQCVEFNIQYIFFF